MEKPLRQQLIELAEEDYKRFSSSLLPGVTNILGVRLPTLRKLAKEIAKKDWRSYLKEASDDSFEEVMLQGMVIGSAKADIEELFSYVKAFVPKIYNWSICDGFCVSLKITKQYKAWVWEFLKPYASSQNEYEIRFCVVMWMTYYIEEAYIDEIFQGLNSIQSEDYYAKMAIAWAISICYTKFPLETKAFLNKNNLNQETYNKALQKIIESQKVSKEDKEIMRRMKRA